MLGPILIFVGGVATAVAVGAAGLYVWQRKRQESAPEVRDAPLPERASHTSDPFAQYWSQRLLEMIEWRRYEQLITAYIGHLGFEVRPVRISADGVVELHGYEPGVDTPNMVVLCKAWDRHRLDADFIQALHQRMTELGVMQGACFNTADFTQAARDFAQGREIDLVNGPELLARVGELPLNTQNELLDLVTDGDYTTPTCPACDLKMIRRVVVNGAQAGVYFWGCRNHPTCARTFPIA